MALTMTRTRTQKALDSLARLIADIHGEIALLEKLIDQHHTDTKLLQAMKARHAILLADKEAVYLTVRQFDEALDPTRIGISERWLKRFGRIGSAAAVQRYIAALLQSSRIEDCSH